MPVDMTAKMTEGGIKIKKGKLRGIESNGMMCSIEELGSTRDMYPEAPEYGIYIFAEDEVKPGDDAVKASRPWMIRIVEYEITNNRVDCFSVSLELPEKQQQPLRKNLYRRL